MDKNRSNTDYVCVHYHYGEMDQVLFFPYDTTSSGTQTEALINKARTSADKETYIKWNDPITHEIETLCDCPYVFPYNVIDVVDIWVD